MSAVDLTRPRTVKLPHAQEVLLVFDSGCRGARVTPSPSSELNLVVRQEGWGLVSEIQGPHGLVGGVYSSPRRGAVHLHVVPASGRPYAVTLSFEDGAQ